MSEATTGNNNGNYKDGESLEQHYCIDCEEEISYTNWLYGQGRCQSCAKKGKRSSSWKGGITPLVNLIRGIKEYYNWRTQVFKRDNFICQECGQKSIGNLEAHHIKPFAELLSEFLKEYNQFSPIEDKETLLRLAMKYKLFWNINNGKTLCEDCHKLIRKKRRNNNGKHRKNTRRN